MKQKWQATGFLLLIGLAVWLRLSQYHDLSGSVSNYDSDRYAIAGQLPFPSREFFTSSQQPTTALMYRWLEGPQGYQITNISSPGDQMHPPLAPQPGFERITTFQAAAATLAWGALAWAGFRSLRVAPLKHLAAGLVLLFGFSPQVVEWDYVMLSEPLAVSLLALLLALSIDLIRLASGPGAGRGKLLGLAAVWLGVVILWVFARDTNIYMLPVFALALVVLRFWQPDRAALPSALLAGLGVALMLLFFSASNLAHESGRWVNPFFNNLLARVLPVPEHRAFFEARGLPVSPELLAEVGGNLTEPLLFTLHDLVAWTEANGTRTYIAFLASHPQWAMQELANDTDFSFLENAQPFFRRDPEVTPPFLVYLGNLLHPMDSRIIFLVTGLLVAFLWLSLKTGDKQANGMALLLWLFFGGSLGTLFVSIHGDAAGIVRHSLSSILLFRLFVWLVPLYLLDTLAFNRQASKA